jgi:hypothetical protein
MRLAILVALALSFVQGSARARSDFRTSLTATVTGDSTPGNSPLRCRQVMLRWGEHPGATRYEVHVSLAAAGPWNRLPASNVCGSVRTARGTELTDAEPTAGASTVVRRLYYRVMAFDRRQAIGATDPIPVQLP